MGAGQQRAAGVVSTAKMKSGFGRLEVDRVTFIAKKRNLRKPKVFVLFLV